MSPGKVSGHWYFVRLIFLIYQIHWGFVGPVAGGTFSGRNSALGIWATGALNGFAGGRGKGKAASRRWCLEAGLLAAAAAAARWGGGGTIRPPPSPAAASRHHRHSPQHRSPTIVAAPIAVAPSPSLTSHRRHRHRCSIAIITIIDQHRRSPSIAALATNICAPNNYRYSNRPARTAYLGIAPFYPSLCLPAAVSAILPP